VHRVVPYIGAVPTAVIATSAPQAGEGVQDLVDAGPGRFVWQGTQPRKL
jgi:hypothetical protein